MALSFYFIAVLAILACSSEAADFLKVNTTTRQITDSTGRARIFHGVNVVYKMFPFHPTNTTFNPEFSLSKDDVDFLVENGFNVVRLYVAWPGVEPKKGQYNTTYLGVLTDIVNMLGDSGIYTILDCHQDLWSPKFCGEGAPDYAALYKNRSSKPLPFPQLIPSVYPYKVDPDTGYPLKKECSRHSFYTYYFSDAVGKAMQSLYDNEQQIQDQFAKFWAMVASAFSTNPYVLGYELLNEPWAGDVYKDLNHLEPRVADSKNLMPMYKKLHTAIRQHDNDHIIFYEPTSIITDLPLKSFSSSGLSEGPGGASYNDRQVFSYHIYCILLDKNGQPRSDRFCNSSDNGLMQMRIADAKKMGVAGFMTEWGAYDNQTEPGTRSYEEGLKMASLADEYLQSWTYWQYKGYGDFTTQSNTGEGLWHANGTAQTSKLKLLSRSYAVAVSGQYVSQLFHPENGTFILIYAASLSLAQKNETTAIYLNEKLYYSSGYTVNIEPSGSATYKSTHNKVSVIANAKTIKNGEHITVTIAPK